MEDDIGDDGSGDDEEGDETDDPRVREDGKDGGEDEDDDGDELEELGLDVVGHGSEGCKHCDGVFSKGKIPRCFCILPLANPKSVTSLPLDVSSVFFLEDRHAVMDLPGSSQENIERRVLL